MEGQSITIRCEAAHADRVLCGQIFRLHKLISALCKQCRFLLFVLLKDWPHSALVYSWSVELAPVHINAYHKYSLKGKKKEKQRKRKTGEVWRSVLTISPVSVHRNATVGLGKEYSRGCTGRSRRWGGCEGPGLAGLCGAPGGTAAVGRRGGLAVALRGASVCCPGASFPEPGTGRRVFQGHFVRGGLAGQWRLCTTVPVSRCVSDGAF